MKWKVAHKQRFIVALVLLVTFVLVLLNNLMSKSQMSHLGTSMTSVYADRLQVEGFIYELSEVMYCKKILFMEHRAAANPGLYTTIHQLNGRTDTLTRAYSTTVFTLAEKACFNKLTATMEALRQLEAKTNNVHPPLEDAHYNMLQHKLDLSLNYLRQLSDIQIKEAQLISEKSRQIIAGNAVFGEAEFAVLLVVGIIIQVILFTQQAFVTPNRIAKEQLN